MKLNINGVSNGIKINYVIDCEKRKIILAMPESNVNE